MDDITDTPKQDAPGNAAKDPDDWVTGRRGDDRRAGELSQDVERGGGRGVRSWPEQGGCLKAH